MTSMNWTGLPRPSSAHAFPLCCAVAALFACLTTTSIVQAQTADDPTFRRDATVKVHTADETTVPKTTRPLTPSDKLRAPFPPEKTGCAHLVNNVWESVPCATEEYKKAHYMPPPVLANSIQSTAHRGLMFIIEKPCCRIESTTITSPFDWGSVSVNQTSDPATATEESGGVSSAFSIQTNTNTFACAPCKSGSPFAATAGVPNSASEKGDSGWVQFVYQQFKTGSSAGKGNTRLCVWNVDVTIAQNTSNSGPGYASTCVYPSASEAVAPLDGSGSAIGGAEVIGYVQCPTAGSYSGCTLWVVAQLPWSPGSGWWAISAPDTMGLAGNWFNVGGTILGSGGGNEAIFTGSQFQQEVRAYSCYSSPTSATGYAPTACPNPSPYNFFAHYFELTASPASYDPTGESNNLTNDPVTISCGDYDCWMSYNSTN